VLAPYLTTLQPVGRVEYKKTYAAINFHLIFWTYGALIISPQWKVGTSFICLASGLRVMLFALPTHSAS